LAHLIALDLQETKLLPEGSNGDKLFKTGISKYGLHYTPSNYVLLLMHNIIRTNIRDYQLYFETQACISFLTSTKDWQTPPYSPELAHATKHFQKRKRSLGYSKRIPIEQLVGQARPN